MEQQNEDNRYYIPDVEDLRMNYEYWYNVEQVQYPDNWTEWTIEDEEDYVTAIRYLKMGVLRTMYLTKEQKEELGWKEVNNSFMFPPWYSYEKGLWSLGYNIESHQIGILIKDPSTVPDYPRDCGSYRGECKSINDLRKIMKWLKIEQYAVT